MTADEKLRCAVIDALWPVLIDFGFPGGQAGTLALADRIAKEVCEARTATEDSGESKVRP
ncbi:hypothetical protein [Pelagibius litoralis]|uniref:hypothetical protein n=1 Tax=Pelagibius litoralis TaxID=374515 RepID=UPI001421C338|nr:hypothetical protein [Pelagibius litoralis]